MEIPAPPSLPPKAKRIAFERSAVLQPEEKEEARISAMLHARVLLRDAMGQTKSGGLSIQNPSPQEYTPTLPQASNGFTIQGKTDPIGTPRAEGPGPAAHFNSLGLSQRTGVSMGLKGETIEGSKCITRVMFRLY